MAAVGRGTDVKHLFQVILAKVGRTDEVRAPSRGCLRPRRCSFTPEGLLRRKGMGCSQAEVGTSGFCFGTFGILAKLFALESVPLSTSAGCLLCTKLRTSQRVSA